jgi:hypothetical protein
MLDSWRQICLNAYCEQGVDRIRHAVAAAEAAIFERWQELGESRGHIVERAALQAAIDELLIIKTQKLCSPNSAYPIDYVAVK